MEEYFLYFVITTGRQAIFLPEQMHFGFRLRFTLSFFAITGAGELKWTRQNVA